MLPLIGIGCPLKYGLVFGAGEKVSVPAKWVPHFKAGKELRERVDLSGN